MVSMAYPHTQTEQQRRYRTAPRGSNAASSRKSREAALENADCQRHGYILMDRTLGTGAYAKVRLARVGERKLERSLKMREDLKEKGHDMVAIKVISKKEAPSEYIHKFMPREIDALRVTYKHPHLIHMYEVFRTETHIYLVMDYAPNGDILSYINECVLETGCAVKEDTARRLFKHIMSGVAHCHQLNIVHRDLKCENILLDENDDVKISDFGFACRFPTNRCNMLSTFCGSYAYAAPEILCAKNYDGKLADIWSLGVVLFAMVNGRLPFSDHNLNTLLEQTRRKLNFQPWVSAECADLTRKLLRTRPLTRLRMHEIISHPWVRKNLKTKNMPAFPSSQAFLKVIQESSDEEALGDKSDDKPPSKSPKEPTLVLKPNGETVRFDDKRLKGKQSPVSKHAHSPHYNTTQLVTSGRCSAQTSSSPESASQPKIKAANERSRMKNLYHRILKPGSGNNDYVFEVVENQLEQKKLIEKRLQIDTRGKTPAPPKKFRVDNRRQGTRHAAQTVSPEEVRTSPSPRHTKTFTPVRTMSDVTGDVNSLAGYATTLVPVNTKDRAASRTARRGSPGKGSGTKISFRLGLSPTEPPTEQVANVKISPKDSRKQSSASGSAHWKKGASTVPGFIHVRGKTELWKRALSGTRQRRSTAANDLRLESPSPSGVSPVPAALPAGGGGRGGGAGGGISKYKAKMRILARRNLLHGVMLKPEPEVRTSQLLDQLQNNLPFLNEVAT